MDKIKLCLYFTDIKEIFRTYDENVNIERLEGLNEYDFSPSQIKLKFKNRFDIYVLLYMHLLVEELDGAQKI
jgi:hypothetical protein